MILRPPHFATTIKFLTQLAEGLVLRGNFMRAPYGPSMELLKTYSALRLLDDRHPGRTLAKHLLKRCPTEAAYVRANRKRLEGELALLARTARSGTYNDFLSVLKSTRRQGIETLRDLLQVVGIEVLQGS